MKGASYVPDPHDALPLPPRPSLEQYRKQAKDLVKACKSADRDAIGAWSARWVATLVRLTGLTVTPQLPVDIEHWVKQLEEFARRKLTNSRGTHCALTDAQFVIARAHGFENWPAFAKHLQGLAGAGSPVSAFESAADAIVTGDLAALERLVRDNPTLIRARSTREHRATLLHYVSANGIEGYRQRTPRNAVKVAGLLLDAGAEVDATADVYGGGATTLGLVATSLHPQQAGVQNALMELLLNRGAAMDSPGHAANGSSLLMACLANGRGAAAEFLAERGARLDLESAAGVGRLDLVKSFFDEYGGLRAGSTKEQVTNALIWACEYNRCRRRRVSPAAGCRPRPTVWAEGTDGAALGGVRRTRRHGQVTTGT